MIRSLCLTTALLLLAIAPAMAQVNPAGQLGAIASPDGHDHTPRARQVQRPAPAAVPGARAEPDQVAPATRQAADMPPTEALFDAVNRGDLAAAKDAIGRGADIYGHNVLGLTPLDLSVDLGRNDISFLLLSLRGAAGYNTRGAAAHPIPPTPTAADRRTERRAERDARRQQQAADRRSRAVSARPAGARLFANDGGTPVPQAGFLGFGANH
jgi:hypothetical protein